MRSYAVITRSRLALGASGLAGLAAVIANIDGDRDILPFFIGITLVGAVAAWSVRTPFTGSRRILARGMALLWALAAAWIGVLLVMLHTVWQASSPPPGPEATYLGLTATMYHLLGLYGGAPLIVAAAFGPDRWFKA